MHTSKINSSERIVDFRASNLHVLWYSVPFHTRIGLSELRVCFGME
jgi:aminopeptidase-like protein